MSHGQFNRVVQFDFIFGTRQSASDVFVAVAGEKIPLFLVRSARARRYVLRLQNDRTLRVTIPRRGTEAEARRFAARQILWIQRQLQKLSERKRMPPEWAAGTEILFRGVALKLEQDSGTSEIRLGSERILHSGSTASMRRTVERHLWSTASQELPPRVLELARAHQLDVRRVSVRNQKSRWGSCSRRGTISLNWRLIQAPDFVRDYVILHELCHLWHMNHSRRFWGAVESVCPGFRLAEEWLRGHAFLLS